MKKFKFLSFLMCCMSALLVTSCLNDDDDSGLTPEQQGICLNAIKGSYTGKLIYPSENQTNSKDQTDTLDMTCVVNPIDTTVVLYNFPAQLVAKWIKDGEVKDALMDATVQNVRSKMYFYTNSPYIGFMMYPMPVEYNVFYDGKSHKVTAYFYSGQYSYGIHSAAQKQMQLQYILGAIVLDDDTQNNLMNTSAYPAFLFDSKW